jgi:hypothetical protein
MKKEKQFPKFISKFNDLENPEILKLQRLFEDTVCSDDIKTRRNKLVVFKKLWKKLFNKYLGNKDVDRLHLRQLLKFFRRNIHLLDRGGMLLGGSHVAVKNFYKE